MHLLITIILVLIQALIGKLFDYKLGKYLEKKDRSIKPKTLKQIRLGYFIIFVLIIVYLFSSPEISKQISAVLFPLEKKDTPEPTPGKSITPFIDTSSLNPVSNPKEDSISYTRIHQSQKDSVPAINNLLTKQTKIDSIFKLPKEKSGRIDTLEYTFTVNTRKDTNIPFKKGDTIIILAKGTIKDQLLEGIIEYDANGLSSVPMAMSRIDRRFPYGSLLAKPTGAKNWNLCGIYYKKNVISDNGYLSFAINDNLKMADSEGFQVTVWLLRLHDK